MRVPSRLVGLMDEGLIDAVIRPLMSGKEAQVYLVETAGERRVAKVYKEATERTFRHRATYTEGRRTRNSRDQRAVAKRTRHGREHDEERWRSAEADVIYRLDAAGVRVPKPYAFVDGVLVMELIAGAEGEPAPRLSEAHIDLADAPGLFERILREVVRMLCAGIVHGDLSSFNILIEPAGPVIIDFPQAIDAASNRNARTVLIRDVANVIRHLRPDEPPHLMRFAEEMWALYERGELEPGTPLTGRYQRDERRVHAERVLDEVRRVEQEVEPRLPERRPKRGSGQSAPRAELPSDAPPGGGPSGGRGRGRRRRK